MSGGLDRLRDAVLDRVERRPSSHSLVAAAEAAGPTAGLDSDEAMAVVAPEAPRSLAETGRAVFQGLRAQLEARGVPWEAATRTAARCAGGLVLELAGFERAEVVGRLGITPRTLERDRSLLRAAGSGVLEEDDGL